jgi:hypothetical protein
MRQMGPRRSETDASPQYMKTWLATAALFAAHLAAASNLVAATYTNVASTIDSGGAPASSPNYSSAANGFSQCCIAEGGAVSSDSYVSKSGLGGQIFELVGFVIDADSSTLAEGASLQLLAARLLDDATRLALPATSVTWSIESGPLTTINAAGIASAGTVYEDTNAAARGGFESFTSTLSLTVLNVNTDDLPGYAGDQIDDAWQVQYFGLPPNPNAGPNVDADGSGHGNLFKFVAGLNPLDGSRFHLAAASQGSGPSQMNITFQPIVQGRSYAVESKRSLGSPDWQPLSNSGSVDHGNVRTVTDYDALPAPKFYRVRISR